MRVTHGKRRAQGRTQPAGEKPRHHLVAPAPQVLGFTSRLPRHGGTGSVYVMLRRTMLEGRDE
ncbi:hypothetical protein ACPA9J_07970 [Pseudomonas aeruginosa]